LLRKLPAQALTSSTVADGDTVVVQLWGEHDGSTVPVLSKILASAVGLDEANLVVDLSRVQFINSATVRVFIASSEFLGESSRTFVLRSPSRSARRVIDLCGAGALIEAAPARSAPPVQQPPLPTRATSRNNQFLRSGHLRWPTVPEGT
jgi:anti-sigma B factor antagonist